MSTSMCKKIQSQFLSSSLRKEEEIMLLQKQGIATILGPEEMKKDASSAEELSHSKVTTTTNVDSKKGAEFDLWSSILLPQKAKDETTNAIITTPYIHPLVKKSKSLLSQKSLEICTESLGSETGSDGFSSEEYKEEKEQLQQQQQHLQPHDEVVVEFEDLRVPEYKSSNTTTTTSDTKVGLTVTSIEISSQRSNKYKSSHHSFPPPLPSLRMVSHRDNGRLFLQAMFVPSNNNFCAKRQDGRLVLTFVDEEDESQAHSMKDMKDDEEEEKEVENDEENGVRNIENETEKATIILSSGITSVHKLALVLNNKAKWSEKFNESLLHRPRLARLKRHLWHQHQQQQLRLLSLLMKTTGGPSPLQKLLHFLTHLPINNI
ncbi:hypothetical protein RIF29_27465 [Crotalaria pallida]|uniref:FAF domain-containing protein n=1 Tax=Crotalaria pallida TaxID=3830 RepID=A0AAN9I2D7_CROPI